jgi:signal transduction histidine kinase
MHGTGFPHPGLHRTGLRAGTWVSGRQWAGDAALALAVTAVIVVTTTAAPGGDTGLTWLALLTAVVAGAVLAFRRRFPYVVLGVSALAAELFLVQYHGFQGTMVVAAPLIALYTVAERARSRHGLAVAVPLVLVSGVAHVFAKPQSWVGTDNLALAALGAVAIVAGAATRARRDGLDEAQARAARAEADREAEATRRVTEERLRIARDLHDAVGHQLALINVQSRVAAHLLDERPDQARAALAHVTEASRVALGELTDTIGLLRQPDDPDEPVAPPVGLAALEELFGGYRASGLEVEARTEGVPGPLPAPVDLTGYRVVQEALTNVCKHAGPTRVRVLVRHLPEALEVVVDNEPTGRSPAGVTGHGLVGMRERVAALGGRLDAGVRPDGGYRVSAVLPLTHTAVGVAG